LIEVGRWLKKAQSELNNRGGNGQGFVEWVELETPYSIPASYKLINAFERFGENDFSKSINHFSKEVIFTVAAPSTPDSVIEEVTEKAEQGEKVTAAEVKRLKTDHKAQLENVQDELAGLHSENADLESQVSEQQVEIETLKKVEPEKVDRPISEYPEYQELVQEKEILEGRHDYLQE